MSKVEVVCPFCRKPNAVEKNSLGASAHGLQDVQCSHCSKRWEENLSESGPLAKSAPAPSSELAALRVQVRSQMDELAKKINGLIERRTAATPPARFNTNGVEKSDVAQQELAQGACKQYAG
jgi:predicted Zn finger-like uncharacterized protein